MRNIFLKNFKLYSFSILVLFLLGFLVFQSWEFSSSASADSESDAIAIRVLKNENNYNPTRWYKKQGFKGSPQKLTVDGYEAIQVGRTTFVNVGNTSGGDLNAYIYLISYDQNAGPAIRKVYNSILKHWNFNTNLSSGDKFGACNISSWLCQSNKDCPQSYTCQENRCLPDKKSNCRIDSDCPQGLFCDSEKAKIIRDTKRVGDLHQIEAILEEKKNYPPLEAGTYKKNQTISVWPSWKNEFAGQLGEQPPLDPINTIATCTPSYSCSDCDYNLRTCWDSNNNQFLDGSPDNLPSGSHVYSYEKTDSGYNICAPIETTYDISTVDDGSSFCPDPSIGVSIP